MSSLKLRKSRALRHPGEQRKRLLIAIIVAALCIALCITVVFLIRSGRRMDEGRMQIEETILDNMTMMLRTYDRFTETKADIGGQLLPDISKHLYTAYTQDSVLIDLHGARASILGNELYTQINAAVDVIDREIKADRIVNVTENALTPYMAQIREILDARQGHTGNNMAA